MSINIKKIITTILITAFICIQNSVFAAGKTIDTSAINLNMPEIDAFNKNYQDKNIEIKDIDISPIEKLYNGAEAIQKDFILRQAGYEVFNISPSSGSGSTGKFGNDYKLSVGEKIRLYLYGNAMDVMAISGSSLLSPVIDTEVDSKGNIFIQGLGVVAAENKNLNEVETEVNKLAAKKYRSLKIKVNIASGQDFSVFVYGNVNRPGKVLISSNSSLLDALSAAGGVKKTGSLRQVSYTSNQKTIKVDLYETIFFGNDKNIILKPNDKIFVEPIGKTIAIKNGVAVPGIYEAKADETFQKIIKYAGGFLADTQITEVTMTRFDPETKQRKASTLTWINAQNTKIKNGDSIEFKSLYNEAENTVVLQGNVKHPATYAYKENMHLSDILKSEDELLEETFITQAVIRRVSGKNNTVETIPIFLKEFFAGISDPLLMPRDVINIYKNTNASFVDVYGCINTPKHITYKDNMKLIDVMGDVQFVESNTDDLETAEDQPNYQDVKNKLFLEGSTTKTEKLIDTENVAVEIIKESGDIQLYYLYDILINSDRIKSIDLDPNDKVFFRTIRGNEMIKTVKVSGFVKQPGVFKFVAGKTLSEMIEMAGGLADDADLRGIVLKRKNLQTKQVELAKKNMEKDINLLEGRIASAYKASNDDIKNKTEVLDILKEKSTQLDKVYTGQIALNITSNDLSRIKKENNIQIQDGDEIYIPRISNYITVLGEVYNEQSFLYKDGLRVKDYIKQVGGYTPNANKLRIYKVGVNGRAEKVGKRAKVAQGDTIVVPKKIAGNDWLTPVCSALQGVASVLSTAFIITKWNK